MNCHSKTTLAIAVFLVIGPAFGAQRTFVSTSGVNNPACSLAAPCRQFAAAVAATDPNGEVIVLDSGGYGTVMITQSVSIIAPPGVYAGISAFGPDPGVTVAAGLNGKVVLRGLTINGQGANFGISVTYTQEVHIENCTVANMGWSGIQVNAPWPTAVHIRGSIFRSNWFFGLEIDGGAMVFVDDSEFARNGRGINVFQGTLHASRIVAEDNKFVGVDTYGSGGGVFVTVTDSTLSRNDAAGALAYAVSGPVQMKFVRTTSANNGGMGGFAVNSGAGAPAATIIVSDSAAVANLGAGVSVFGPGATAIVSGSTLAGNAGADLFNGGPPDAGVLRSAGNNAVTGRGAADISGTITPNPLK